MIDLMNYEKGTYVITRCDSIEFSKQYGEDKISVVIESPNLSLQLNDYDEMIKSPKETVIDIIVHPWENIFSDDVEIIFTGEFKNIITNETIEDTAIMKINESNKE